MTRAEDIASFLNDAGWGKALTENMEADFSTRRFTRLHRDDGETAILMDADQDQKTVEFVVLAWLLRTVNLSSPVIIADQRQNGLVLMEDLGEANIGRLISNDMHDVSSFYNRAAEVLAHLYRNFQLTMVNDLKLPRYTAALFAKQAEKFLDGYFPFALQRKATDQERNKFKSIWLEALKPVDTLPQTLMLRDFMPDNTMDLPERKSWQSIGLLDFQDAGIGPVAYDIASYCEVVRRDGGDAYLEPVIAHYFERAQIPCNMETLQNGCYLLAAQRHIRILGILGGLAQKDPNSEKLAYMPRVETYVKRLLQDKALRPVRSWMTSLGLFT